jgi:AraC family transcriptional regulator
MDVKIVDFPETKVAAIEHHGPPHLEYETARKLIEWRVANRLHPDRHRSYGVHYTDPYNTAPEDHRVDFCVSVDSKVAPNPQGVVNKIIPGGRCAVARHIGSRENVTAASYLYEVWLPNSGEELRGFPIFFHYVNVGPNVQEHEMITDVYLPLR